MCVCVCVCVCVIVLMYILTTILSCPATACTVGAYINNGRGKKRCSRENHEAEKTREISEREEEKRMEREGEKRKEREVGRKKQRVRKKGESIE